MTPQRRDRQMPGWVPDAVVHYLAHTEGGHSIREIARHTDCHASTILRQIRKLETRRDDPLIDHALSRLSSRYVTRPGPRMIKETRHMASAHTSPSLPEDQKLDQEALRILRRLCETGAVLAVARDMEKAVVVREHESGTARTAVVDTEIAQAMALKDWISCPEPGRVSRYAITAMGRTALNRMMARSENRARGFAEAQAGFANPHLGEAVDGMPAHALAQRFSASDSPLMALARRRDRDGDRFLSEDLVAAGERLREDFEIAQMGAQPAPNWKAFLAGESGWRYTPDTGVSGASAAARQRLAGALAELGAGLADVALRCCCFLEGLETAEKRLGWSARSGKIVLRIALLRLNEYYRSQAGSADHMIG
ncbi:DUF6456 domain-containing protein [Shimia sp. SDUM112013]|uniref:DUF6456 domain-containing protein n=1 Tax=Shimia sp. SDUM112013 TaxID=3136160 RepID=UPI0032ED787E